MAYEITKDELEELKKARAKTQNKNEDKRLQAVILRAEGLNNQEIGEKLDKHPTLISRWICAYKKEGITALLNKKRKGNHRSLTEEEEDEILKEFEEKMEKGQVVEVKEIKAKFDEKIGKDTGRGYIYMLLKRKGYRKVMPRSKHPKKAKEEAIEASKKLTQRQKI